MILLDGNRPVDEDYVLQHFQTWGSRINPATHEMTGLLPDDDTVDLDNFPSGIKVQVVHGQHRKRVLEMQVLRLLEEEYADAHPGCEQPAFTMEQVHAHPMAVWNVRLYGQCEFVFTHLILPLKLGL